MGASRTGNANFTIRDYDVPLYAEHFKILPAIHDWDKDASRIKDGQHVPEGFRYTSDNNTEWMSRETLAAWIEANRHKIGSI